MPSRSASSAAPPQPPAMPSVLAPPPPPPSADMGSTQGAKDARAPTMVSFDPSKAPTPPEETDVDDRRPKKRKSAPNLRGSAQASTSKQVEDGADEDDDEEDGSKLRRKINIEYIEEKSKRHITFSKRKAGIMKKAYELSTLTGTQVLLLVVSESGWVYTFTTDKFKPLVKEDENGQLSAGQKLIAACLEAKDETPVVTQAPTFQPTPHNANFEANSAIHGGQISIKPTSRAPSRPTATNRRVSGKGRPANIRTGSDAGLPPLPQLPMPTSAPPGSGYIDTGLHDPHSPRGPPRALSHPPISPHHHSYNQMQVQQAEYAEMMRMQQQHYDGHYDSMYGQGHPQHMPMLSVHDPMGHPTGDYHSGPPHDTVYSPAPPHHSHYTHHPDPNGPPPSPHRASIGGYPSSSAGTPAPQMNQQVVYGHDDGSYGQR